MDAPSKHRGSWSADIFSMLVNIYGSKELFVNEYCSLLSNLLLANCSYDTDKEIRYLELLKLRFGEVPLHQPEEGTRLVVVNLVRRFSERFGIISFCYILFKCYLIQVY